MTCTTGGSLYSRSLYRAVPKWGRFFLPFMDVFKIYLSSQGLTRAIYKQLSNKTGRYHLLRCLTKIAKCLMAKTHTHPCSAWLERSCATGSRGTCCSPDCWLGIGPCPSVEAELFHLKNTKKFPGVLQLSQFPHEPSHHQPQAALRNGKSSGQSPSPHSHPFNSQIKPPPLTSSTLFLWLSPYKPVSPT